MERLVLALLDINVLWPLILFIGVFAALISISSSTELDFELVLFHFPCARPLPIILYAMLETFTLYCWYFTIDCFGDIPVRNIFCNGYIQAYESIFKVNFLMKKNNPLNLLKITTCEHFPPSPIYFYITQFVKFSTPCKILYGCIINYSNGDTRQF